MSSIWDIGLSLAHHYRVHKKGIPHVTFRKKLYVPFTRYAAPACGSVCPKGIAGAWFFGNGGFAGGCGQLSSTMLTYVRSPTHPRGQRDSHTNHTSPDRAGPAGRGGSYGVRLLPSSIAGGDGCEWCRTIGDTFHDKGQRGHIFTSRTWVGNQGMDSELQSLFIDVVSLPTMITPVTDRALCAPDYADAVIAPPAVSPVVTRPPTATTSAEPNLLSPIRSPASATAVGISSEGTTPPVAAVPENVSMFNAAMTSQTQPETSLFPQVHAPGPDVGLVAGGVTPDMTDRPREGPFNVHHDRQGSTTSPRLLRETQGCLFRMTSYDAESDGPNFSPEHGVQLTDPRFLEYVGAPESALLMSCSPEYWVHHMGVENALSVALQLEHDTGLVLSNEQVLQQIVTSMCRTSSDMLMAVHGGSRFRPVPYSK